MIGRLTATALLVIVALAPSIQAAHAQVLLGNCTIVVQAPGTITNNTSINSLSSKNSGGSRARATVTTNSVLCIIATLLNCYAISAPPPLAFASSPSGANTGTTFSTGFRLNGGPELLGAVPQLVSNGAYNMEVEFSASKATGLFPSGTYRGEVTVRCE